VAYPAHTIDVGVADVSAVVRGSEVLQGRKRYYLALDSETAGNVKNPAIYTFLSFITFWILYSYLVPISLFVTLEIVKFWQGFVFINSDPEMRDGSGEAAKCRNSNLNEDLGKIDYVFSDKTGTLTSNEMRLRLIAIKGQVLGDLNKSLESRPELKGFDALKFFSPALHEALQVLFGLPTLTAWQSQLACPLCSLNGTALLPWSGFYVFKDLSSRYMLVGCICA
jgi:magnesium-transporting ATPase (P-type)